MDINLNDLTAKAAGAIRELIDVADLKPGSILVVGCSTSEVSGHKIGSYSSPEIAQAILNGILPAVNEHQLYLAVQCCEHLNRALVVSGECARTYGLEQVTVVPHLKAGGGFATAYYYSLEEPAMVEGIAAHAGIDIGDTFIGMHLKPVVVPVRGSVKQIGEAHVTMARTRPKLIGGERAHYTREAV